MIRNHPVTLAAVFLGLILVPAKGAEPVKPVVVDEIVVNPAKFKGAVSVAGRVAKAGVNGLFALGCEDACVAMPVKYAGTLPAVGSNVVVRGEIVKDASGRFVFNATTVTKK